MIEDLISIDVSLISNVYYKNHSLDLFSSNVCLRPCRHLIPNLLGSQVRIRAVQSVAEQLALPSSPASLGLLLRGELQLDQKFCYSNVE